jgi:hypothetical protein
LALNRMAAMLVPGGLLQLRDVVFNFEVSQAAAGIDRWLTAAADRPEDGWTRAELEAHLRDEYSTFTWLLEPMIESAGFEIVSADYGTPGVYASYLCTKRTA